MNKTYRVVFADGFSCLCTCADHVWAQEIAIELCESVRGYSAAIRSILRLN